MSKNQNIHYHENLAAYALGALDVDEIQLLEKHLKTCMECQEDLAVYTAVSENLLFALPPQAPTPALKNRLSKHLPKTDEPFWSGVLNNLTKISIGQFTTSAAIILLIVLNFFTLLQWQEVTRQQTEMAHRMEIEQSAIAMLSDPNTKKIAIDQGAVGSLLLNKKTDTAVLLTKDLPELPDDKTYQIWLIDAQGNRFSGGLFITNPGQDISAILVTQPSPLENYIALGVTIEPSGGSPGPTGPNALKISF